jgi:hypothetical protein
MEVASAGSMKPGNGALMPIAAGFFRWNAMRLYLKTPEPSYEMSGTKPVGIAGISSGSSVELQFGQGAPATPQPQAIPPKNGRSGWFSQTQRQLSQREQFRIRVPPRKPIAML